MSVMKNRTKIARVGAGGWGRQHARIFSERPDVEFCAVAGRTAERTEARAREYGVRAYTDIGEMLDREKPDLVSVCLPNEGHFLPTLQVIEAGFPLLVEKPLVFDLADAARSGIQKAVLCDHLQPSVRKARADGPAGNP